jgi:chromatin segregation and condensation protein Rec8/ScpA/Scc1 (kleisin family)
VSKRKPELKLVEDTGSELLAEELIPELPPQQSEMPFAVVEGEPMTELPRDLYIPPDALQVFLEAFEGPLDLLLYLIRKQNLDILDIPIAEITRQYMKYIDVMADLQLELAGEYLLMAAMLAEIKSRMLLPRPPSADGHDEDDPRAELVRRLQEYERFKKAAEDIDKLARLERDTMPASAELQERKVVTLMPDVTLKEMLMAFKDVLSRAEKFAHHHITRERLSQRERMSEILNRLQTTAFFEFTQLFRPEEGRMGVTVTFIAILELMKEGLIEIVQAEAYGPIHVRTAQRHLKVVAGNAAVVASVEADAENVAALAQPELEGENDIDDEIEAPAEAAQPEDAAVEGALAEAEAVAAALGVDDVVTGDAIVVSDATEAPVVPSDIVAEETFAVIQETSGDVQAFVALATEASEEQGAAPETTVEEHVVEEHVVPEHVVEENVVPEHVVEESTAQLDPAVEPDAAPAEVPMDVGDISDEPVASAPMDAGSAAVEDQPALESAESNEQSSDQHHELSPDDDSVTESSSEADNSDAEPSR